LIILSNKKNLINVIVANDRSKAFSTSKPWRYYPLKTNYISRACAMIKFIFSKFDYISGGSARIFQDTMR